MNKTRIPLGADVPPAVTGPSLPGGLLPGGEGCPGPAGRLPSWPEGRAGAGCRFLRLPVAGRNALTGVGTFVRCLCSALPCPLACGGPGSRLGSPPSGDAHAKPLLSRAHTSLQSTFHSFGLWLRKELNGLRSHLAQRPFDGATPISDRSCSRVSSRTANGRLAPDSAGTPSADACLQRVIITRTACSRPPASPLLITSHSSRF